MSDKVGNVPLCFYARGWAANNVRGKRGLEMLDWSGIDFCTDIGELTGKEVSSQLVRHIFPAGLKKIFATRYQRMSTNFSKGETEIREWEQEGLEILSIDKHQDARLRIGAEWFEEESNLWREIMRNPCIGHDLPIWLQKKNVLNPLRVMIVGNEPLRKRQESGMITISSPFGLHSPKYRRREDRKIVTKVIHKMVKEKNCCVYCTDYTKVYCGMPCENCCGSCNPDETQEIRRRAKEFRGEMKPWYKKMLEVECKMFHPELVITLGKPALVAVGRMNFDRGVVQVGKWHPDAWRQKSRDSRRKELGGCEPIDEAIVQYYLNEVDSRILNGK